LYKPEKLLCVSPNPKNKSATLPQQLSSAGSVANIIFRRRPFLWDTKDQDDDT
jgi:hypothetical protein